MNVIEDTKLPAISEAVIGGHVLQTANARDLHAYLEVGKDFSTWIKDRIAGFGFVEGLDFIIEAQSPNLGSGNRGVKTEYYLTLDMAKELAMVERNQKGKEARLHFIECERRLKTVMNVAIPNFSDPVAAARAWANEVEARRLAERTKAEIGTRREATAMNTASQAVKKVEKLERELDQSKKYATVKRMGMLYHGQEFSWRLLKHISSEMGISPIDVFDANYGTVKAYHADVWQEAYALEIPASGQRGAP